MVNKTANLYKSEQACLTYIYYISNLLCVSFKKICITLVNYVGALSRLLMQSLKYINNK